MRPFPETPDLLAVARRIVWFDPPEATLAQPVRFLVYLMTHGAPEDLRHVQAVASEGQFREALENAPPGIFRESDWKAWNEKLGRVPVPPMPLRFPEFPRKPSWP